MKATTSAGYWAIVRRGYFGRSAEILRVEDLPGHEITGGRRWPDRFSASYGPLVLRA